MSTETRSPSIFEARLRFWMLTGIAIGVLAATALVLALTQTRWGHRLVLGFTLQAASERLDGTLTVERLSGNLLAGARLYGVALRGLDDEPFVLADSAFVEYSLRTIAGDEIVLDRVTLYNAEVYLRQLPGDTLWNYDKIFGDTLPPVEPRAPRRPLVVRHASLVGGRIVVERPWEPDPELPPAERQRELEAALADTSRILVRRVPGGYLRQIVFGDVDAELSRIVSAPDELGGTSLRIERFRGDIHLFREPVPVRRLETDLAFAAGLLQFQASAVELPASRLSAFGAIRFGIEGGPQLDLTVRGDTVAFADLRWLNPQFPEEGGGSLSFLIESRPEGTLFLAREARIAAPGTRLQGSFGLVLNHELRFVEVDLRADPLRVSTIEQMLPVDIPVTGLRIGGVEIRQPAS